MQNLILKIWPGTGTLPALTSLQVVEVLFVWIRRALLGQGVHLSAFECDVHSPRAEKSSSSDGPSSVVSSFEFLPCLFL